MGLIKNRKRRAVKLNFEENIAFGWSERGAARMACVILRRITEPAEWDAYWRQRLGLNDNVNLSLRSSKPCKGTPILWDVSHSFRFSIRLLNDS